MASPSSAVAAQPRIGASHDDGANGDRADPDGTKIRISKVGGRYLVFDVTDVARLRRQHNMCAILVGTTPQAPNQNVFSSLPLELTADEVRWLVYQRRAAYVADDLQAHLTSLAQPAARRTYLESMWQQRQLAQVALDEAMAERERRGAEVRANMALTRGERKSKRAAKAGKNIEENEAKKTKEAKDANVSEETLSKEPAQPVIAEKEAPSVPAETADKVAVAVLHKVLLLTATDRANDHADMEPLLQLPPRTEEVMQKEDGFIFGGPVEVERMKAERDWQTNVVQQKEKQKQTETVPPPASSPKKEDEKDATKKTKTPLVQITPTTSSGLVGGDEDADLDDVGGAALHAPAPSSTLAASTSSAAMVRAHLANLGFYTTPGLRFGGALSVYPGDPFRYHAHFVATSYGWDEPIPLLDVVSTGRLATGVKKGLLIGGARPAEDGDADGSNVRTFTLEWAAI